MEFGYFISSRKSHYQSKSQHVFLKLERQHVNTGCLNLKDMDSLCLGL